MILNSSILASWFRPRGAVRLGLHAAPRSPMNHSIALVTGATSGLGQAAARLLAGQGWHEIIVTGRTLAGAQEAAAQLAAETKKKIFTPLELDLNTPASVHAAVAMLTKRRSEE